MSRQDLVHFYFIAIDVISIIIITVLTNLVALSCEHLTKRHICIVPRFIVKILIIKLICDTTW